MGQFSWITQDTDEQIYNDYDHQTVHMVDPRDGKDYVETAYKGYGIFGGRDFYELFADINRDYILNHFKKLESEKEHEDSVKLYNKKFEELTEEDIDEKRSDGIYIWFDSKHEETKDLPSPILVHDYNNWKYYKNSRPKDDPDQGWHMEDDEDEYWEDENVEE